MGILIEGISVKQLENLRTIGKKILDKVSAIYGYAADFHRDQSQQIVAHVVYDMTHGDMPGHSKHNHGGHFGDFHNCVFVDICIDPNYEEGALRYTQHGKEGVMKPDIATGHGHTVIFPANIIHWVDKVGIRQYNSESYKTFGQSRREHLVVVVELDKSKPIAPAHVESEEKTQDSGQFAGRPWGHLIHQTTDIRRRLATARTKREA